MKIIPAIDLMSGQVVRLFKGDATKKTIYSSNPMDVAKEWESQGADSIHIVDLDATLGLGNNYDIIKKICHEIDTPIQVAGGLRNRKMITDVLEFASRCVIGTLAFMDQKSVVELLKIYQNEKIVISADYVQEKIVTHGWQKDSDITIESAINNFITLGFTEFLLTNVELDGTMQGPDVNVLKELCSNKIANIIASGGVSSLQDVKNVKDTGADAIILGKAIYEKKFTVSEAKQI